MVRMPIQSLTSRHHCVYSIKYHLVLVTKYRKRCLTKPMLDMIAALARERAQAWDGSIIEVNGEADHVHFLVDLPPHHAVSEFVNALKTNTSRLLRRDFRADLDRFYRSPVLWSRSYCVISVGGAPLKVLKAYIQQQDAPI